MSEIISRKINVQILGYTGSVNFPPATWVTGSVIDLTSIGYYKAFTVYFASGSATSFGTSTLVTDFQQSHDGITGWQAVGGNLVATSGSFYNLGVWLMYDFSSTYLPFIRFCIRNNSGSTVSGSYAVIGYKYT